MSWDPQAAAETGATWLDERLPGWADEIDAEVLDMADPCRCVLGQLADALLDAAGVTNIIHPVNYYSVRDRLLDRFSDELGFDIGIGDDGHDVSDKNLYARLEEAWWQQLEARRG